jgi:hypothetical protein
MRPPKQNRSQTKPVPDVSPSIAGGAYKVLPQHQQLKPGTGSTAVAFSGE